jgi:hypothetical protein
LERRAIPRKRYTKLHLLMTGDLMMDISIIIMIWLKDIDVGRFDRPELDMRY